MVNSTTTAPQLIEDQVKGILVEPLEAASVVLQSGPTVFNSSEPLRIKTLEDGFDPGIVGENELIPDDGEATFGEIKLMPTERKSIKAIIRTSNELIRQSTVGVSQTLQARLVKDVANKLDNELLAGTGANDGITGLLNQPGLQTAPISLTDTDPYLDALASMAAKEITPNRFILNGSDFFELRKIKDADGRYIMSGGPAEGVPYKLFEIPVTITNKLQRGQGILANTKDIAVVRDIDPQVTILTERYAEYDQVGIRVVTRYDLGLLRKDSVLLLDAGTSEG
ncbi:phage major capsid protein [Corynebacterium stationis]|uniref:phage major capsid protein n=1 Tax=Corynebacterium stationis TaxID=1705 RepID=UPI00076F68CE|nr:phage major capsid protein [Corynebacterium stationis]AMJ43796.1 capsid protein [Corynebacterium stationis]AMJ45007.1 capsid protein [Corynebacterium stationis]AQX70248.1 capsid protein [Corynebacterium stationis]AQX71456.1 capsid protein [Corynebacterium stationis]ASJ17945.1 capsid protein [Corynebacterium stationis]